SKELAEAAGGAYAVSDLMLRHDELRNTAAHAAALVTAAVLKKSTWVYWERSNARLPWAAGQVPRLHDIIGNPFRLVSLDSSCLTPPVPSLAATSDDERALPSGELDTARLVVLADALEETGCTDTAILGHLRSIGPHWRGCWVVDLLTGRS